MSEKWNLKSGKYSQTALSIENDRVIQSEWFCLRGALSSTTRCSGAAAVNLLRLMREAAACSTRSVGGHFRWIDNFKRLYMSTQKQIQEYIAIQPEPKRSEMQELHSIILELMPQCKLWFLDGKDEKGKTVSNPNIGYGFHTIKYANGKSKDFYQIGVSANTTGITIYLLGIEDKKYLAQKFGNDLGKASVTGYCIKFKTLKDINISVLKLAMQYGIEQTGT